MSVIHVFADGNEVKDITGKVISYDKNNEKIVRFYEYILPNLIKQISDRVIKEGTESLMAHIESNYQKGKYTLSKVKMEKKILSCIVMKDDGTKDLVSYSIESAKIQTKSTKVG